METNGDLPLTTMAAIATTVNNKNQSQNAEQQKLICAKPGYLIIECRKRIRKQQERQGEKQTTE